ncbi:MAG: regulatory protein RecX [Saprospiraceae bacterium]|nr:regulatory protein RecX [Saprospiraceae bacterium]
MSEEPPVGLPATITSISVQKKNKERYTLHVEEGFLAGVSESTLIDLGLAKGVEVTPSLYRKIQRSEGIYAVKSYLIKLLGRRDHARKELYRKALKKQYPKEVIQSVLDELEEKGYIDERQFARKYASDKYRLNSWGPAKIKAHLLKKGVSRQAAEEGVESAFSEADLDSTLMDLVLKKKRRFLREENPLKRKEKIFNYLSRKGFSPGTIFEEIDRLMKAVKDG